MFPAFFFFDLKENQSNPPSDKIISTSFNQEHSRKHCTLIIRKLLRLEKTSKDHQVQLSYQHHHAC